MEKLADIGMFESLGAVGAPVSGLGAFNPVQNAPSGISPISSATPIQSNLPLVEWRKQVDERFGKIDERFGKLESRMDNLEITTKNGFANVDAKLLRLQSDTNTRLDRIEQAIAQR